MNDYATGVSLNGYRERWFAASGSLGFDGFDSGHPPLVRAWKFPFRLLGFLDPRRWTVIPKTLTLSPVKGRLTPWTFWRCCQPLRPLSRRSLTNAVALTNPGLPVWLGADFRRMLRHGLRILPSLQPSSVAEARAMVDLLRPRRKHLAGLQLNRCPNLPAADPEAFLRIFEVLRTADLPVLVKLSLSGGKSYPNWEPLRKLVTALDGKAAAFTAINAAPYEMLHTPAEPSPLARYGYAGSVSGGSLTLLAREALQQLRPLATRTPLIAAGGLVARPGHSLDEEALYRLLVQGADAVEFATAFLWDPSGPGRAADLVDRLLEKTPLLPSLAPA